MRTTPAREVVLFKLKPATDEAHFLAVNETVMPELRAMPGFIRRELLRSADGQWLDTVHWRSLAEAEHAATIFPTLACAQALIGMIDETTMTMLHFEPVTTFDEAAPGGRGGWLSPIG